MKQALVSRFPSNSLKRGAVTFLHRQKQKRRGISPAQRGKSMAAAGTSPATGDGQIAM
ncbi:hypothetical protein [Noviherbaspirillum sp. UKPF54]|uniref:hypothetical protein n=1 Tax=Noviherbaspirillum sp. UKPF54 TaxID=2601898 RepID=UPI00143E0C02|nr:hypothetical protein [Noviherbaspirillum sp. UKPF54]